MLINIEEGLKRLHGNKALYKKMLAMFIVSEEIGQLDEFLKAGKAEEASQSSHAIKGIAGNLSLQDLYAISDTLTEELRKGLLDETTIEDFHSILASTLAAAGEAIDTL